MDSPGRHDPCPCGSGRKYKDCCSGDDEARFATHTSMSTRESAIAKLLAFAFQPAFDNDHSVAEIVFWGDTMRDVPAADLQSLMDSEDATVKYNTWFLFDWDLGGEGTVAGMFLKDEIARLTAAERQFITRLMRAHLRLYEVEGIDPGRGLKLIDLWSRTHLYVIERTASRQAATWDLLGARVAPDGIGGHVFEGGLYLYPADAKVAMLTHFRRLFRRYRRRFPSADSAEFFRKHGMVFHHLWLKLVAFPEPPTVTTSDGDPLMFCRVVFDADDPGEVRDIIARQPEIRPAGDGRLVWVDTNEDERTVVGTWQVEKERIVFETTSQERAARGRAWLEQLAGPGVRCRATAIETLEQVMKALHDDRPDRPPLGEPQSDDGVVRELYDRHYHRWLDRPVPALGNRTPRAAARTKIWRPRLIDLLKRLENGTERAAMAGRQPYDFHWIWRELGLERP